MTKYIGYVRTSTDKQNLGLEEQKSRIIQFVIETGAELIEIYCEQDSGKNNDRLELSNAIHRCVKNGYTLLFTKLDRLSREVEFLFMLRNKGVKMYCIELPELSTLTIGIYGSLSQHERELISSRTKSALSELKKKGVKLGNPQNLTYAARLKGAESMKIQRRDNDNWKMARIVIENLLIKDRDISLTEISSRLNQQGIRTRRGCMFHPSTVKRLLNTI